MWQGVGPLTPALSTPKYSMTNRLPSKAGSRSARKRFQSRLSRRFSTLAGSLCLKTDREGRVQTPTILTVIMTFLFMSKDVKVKIHRALAFSSLEAVLNAA